MDPTIRTQLESWFRYAEDLGLGPYYRDRMSRSVTAAENATPRAWESGADGADASGSVITESPHAILNSMFSVRRAISGGPKPSPSIQVVSGPSLFDERVENDTLDRIRGDMGECTRCKLHTGRKNIVFGVGNSKAELVFVGEGPGHDEDVQGEPFVGRAGKLLTQMIEAMGLKRSDVYICNVVKCRPPENRLPERDEISICSPFLARQLAVIKPRVICCLGACSAQTLLETNQGISRFRGEWFDYRGARLIATYHPAYLLRNPNAKSEVWKDLQKVMKFLGLKPTPRR